MSRGCVGAVAPHLIPTNSMPSYNFLAVIEPEKSVSVLIDKEGCVKVGPIGKRLMVRSMITYSGG